MFAIRWRTAMLWHLNWSWSWMTCCGCWRTRSSKPWCSTPSLWVRPWRNLRCRGRAWHPTLLRWVTLSVCGCVYVFQCGFVCVCVCARAVTWTYLNKLHETFVWTILKIFLKSNSPCVCGCVYEFECICLCVLCSLCLCVRAWVYLHILTVTHSFSQPSRKYKL